MEEDGEGAVAVEATDAGAEEGATAAAFLKGVLGLGLGLEGGDADPSRDERSEAFDPSPSDSSAEEKDGSSSESTSPRFLLVPATEPPPSMGSEMASFLMESLAAVEACRLGRGGMASVRELKGGKRRREGRVELERWREV